MNVTYTFKDGNQFMPNMPARCTLRDTFYQDLLESTDLFKRGIIKLERVIDDNPNSVKTEEKQGKVQIDNITSPDQAIEYVFNTWGIVVKTAKQAVKIASTKGVEFPNMKEKNNDN
jgi:hypothetical protein